jgi:hypothetical protein
VNGDFETGNTSGWTTFVDAGALERVQLSLRLAVSNLVADFSAGNGGAVDAAGQCRFRRKGNLKYRLFISLICGSTGVGGDFCGIFLRAIRRRCFQAEIVTGKPHITPAAWTNYSYTVRTGSDVSGE